MEARRLKRAVMIGCALVATGLAAQNAEADDTYWILLPPDVGDWSTEANWDNGVPNSSDDAYITNGGEARIAADGAEADRLYLGYGTGESGALTQTGGTNMIGWDLYLGRNSGSEGTYQLSGTGSLSAEDEYVGHYGTGTFTQTGGANTIGERLYVGRKSGGEGTYELSGTGSLSADYEYIGRWGTGIFRQTGGTNTIAYYLYLGRNSGGKGTYELSGTGSLSVNDEYLGRDGTGTFTQTGGSNTTDYLSVNSTSRYEFAGGTLQINDGLDLRGTLDFSGAAMALSFSDALVCLSNSVENAENASLEVTGNSLVILPPDFDPAAVFGSYSSAGKTHTAGTTLVVAASEGFSLRGVIDDHVECQGTISATSSKGQGIDLGGGLAVSAGGAVDLGTGTLTVEDAASGISGTGRLSADYEYIGRYGTGTFTQTGGTNTIGENLYLGYYDSGSGTYNLGETGSLSADYEYIGSNGTGTFTQTGGTNTIAYYLYLARNSWGKGTYELSGTGSLSADYEYIGDRGTGTFTETGGTNTVTVSLYLGRYSGSNGTYTMSAGNLSARNFIVGSSGSGTLNITHSAANITVSNLLHFGDDSTLTAVPGAAIHMTGAAFENKSSDPAAMAGLANLELIFEGGPADVDPFEVAGATGGGFDLNFALRALTLGGVDVGIVQLVDLFDNGNRGTEGMECLFTHALTVGEGSELDLNGLWLYVDGNVESILDSWIADGRLFDGTGISLNAMYDAGHDWTLVPEPATLALLAVGLAGLVVRKRRT